MTVSFWQMVFMVVRLFSTTSSYSCTTENQREIAKHRICKEWGRRKIHGEHRNVRNILWKSRQAKLKLETDDLMIFFKSQSNIWSCGQPWMTKRCKISFVVTSWPKKNLTVHMYVQILKVQLWLTALSMSVSLWSLWFFKFFLHFKNPPQCWFAFSGCGGG